MPAARAFCVSSTFPFTKWVCYARVWLRPRTDDTDDDYDDDGDDDDSAWLTSTLTTTTTTMTTATACESDSDSDSVSVWVWADAVAVASPRISATFFTHAHTHQIRSPCAVHFALVRCKRSARICICICICCWANESFRYSHTIQNNKFRLCSTLLCSAQRFHLIVCHAGCRERQKERERARERECQRDESRRAPRCENKCFVCVYLHDSTVLFTYFHVQNWQS